VIRSQTHSPSVRRTQPLAIVLFGASALLFAAGCDAPERVASPESVVPTLDRSEHGERVSAIEQFALAQGTYCNDDGGPPCADVTGGLKIGWILANWGWPPEDAQGFYTVDVGGVNARWWARNRLSPRLPKYRIEGDVRESRLNDGRRRLRISAEIENTFSWIEVDHFDADDNYLYSDRVLGADFWEYPTVDPNTPDYLPQLADMDLELDLVLPADFVGMPDLVEMWYIPNRKPGMEIRRFDLVTRATGRLQGPLNGMAEGTLVNVVVRDDFSEGLTPSVTYRPPRFRITKANGDDDSHHDSAVSTSVRALPGPTRSAEMRQRHPTMIGRRH
jgi:hypothetical protein